MGSYPHQELTEKIIGAAIKVHRQLGPGFLEAIYERALLHELQKNGISADQQKVVPIYYDGIVVGEHRLDLVVEARVLLELKATDGLSPLATAQVISYLKAAGLQVALIINFNETLVRDGIKRIVLDAKNRDEH